MKTKEKSSLFWILFIGIGGFIILFLSSCKIKKDSAKIETKQEIEFKTEYKTKDSLIYQKYIEYNPYFDTITKTLYVYPKYKKINISQNKATERKKDSSIVVVTKKRKSLLQRLIIALFTN
jgi:hypothetical protein